MSYHCFILLYFPDKPPYFHYVKRLALLNASAAEKRGSDQHTYKGTGNDVVRYWLSGSVDALQEIVVSDEWKSG